MVMMEKEDFDIAQLIAQFLSGETNKANLMRLQNWASKSESNKEILRKLLDKNYREIKSNKLNKVDVEKAWSSLIERMPELLNKRATNKKRTVSFKLLKVAAMIVVFLSAFVSIYFLNSRNKLEPIEFDADYTAQLKLSNGKIIDLTSIEGEIALENGEKSIENSNEVLVYSSDNNTSKYEPVEYNEVAVSFGKGYKIILSDNSIVYMNSLSKLKFPVSFSGEKREVFLEGEAYFSVAKNESKPFIVTTNGFSIQALGTSFGVSSYSDDKLFMTTLVEGSVKVSCLMFEPVILTPNEQISFNKETEELSKQTVDVSYFSSWIYGQFRYKDIRLEDLMKIIQRLYNVEVVFSSSDLREYVFGCNINRYEKIEPILRIIETSGNLKIKMKDQVLYVSKN